MSVLRVLASLVPLAFFAMTTGLFASASARTTVASAAISAVTVLLFSALPILITVLIDPVAAGKTNYAAYLLVLDPLMPVGSVLLRQIGEFGYLEQNFAAMGFAGSSPLVRNLTPVSFLVQILISLLFFVLSVTKISKAGD